MPYIMYFGVLSSRVIRTQISLTQEQMDRARAEARRRGVSVAALLRDGLERVLAQGEDDRLREQARTAVGGFRSGCRTTSADHDDALAQDGRW
jgi:hypothetical protein